MYNLLLIKQLMVHLISALLLDTHFERSQRSNGKFCGVNIFVGSHLPVFYSTGRIVNALALLNVTQLSAKDWIEL